MSLDKQIEELKAAICDVTDGIRANRRKRMLEAVDSLTAKLHAAESSSWNEAIEAAIASCVEVGWMSRSFQAEFTRKIEGLKKPEPSATPEGADL